MPQVKHFLSQLAGLLWLRWLSALTLIVLISKLWNTYRRFQSMPPGPRGLPLIGNVFQVPISMPWFLFTKWSREFGPLFSLNLAGQPLVVLNTFKAANDLLERRSSLYSDRPRLIMAGEILSDGMFLAFSRYGPLWRNMRRVAHDGFSGRSAEKYRPLQMKEAVNAALRMIDLPNKWEEHLQRASAAIILTAVYDWDSLTEKDDPIVSQIHSITGRLSTAALPGTYIVEFIPILKYLPTWIAKWKREGIEWHEKQTEMFKNFNRDVEAKKRSGALKPCFVADLLDRKEQHQLTEKEAAWLSGILFTAGAETTAGTLIYFFLAILSYPETMHKAQAELDKVVGRERIPSFNDFEDLLYVRAMVSELLRWRPVAPMAMPRTIQEDDWYDGYLIPKGSMVIANVWAMNMDSEVWENPQEFCPDRFLDGVPEATNPLGHSSYGFGRRICVGWTLANQTLFITIATLLWALNIENPIDQDGQAIVPPTDEFVDHGVIVAPPKIECKISPRFTEVRELLKRDKPEDP